MRGIEADRVAGSFSADALTDGATVAFAAGQGDESPAGLGLLAHELTHIARQRNPGFVPPVLRAAAASPPTDEEAIARQTEAAIRQAARIKMGLEPVEMPVEAPQMPAPPAIRSPLAADAGRGVGANAPMAAPNAPARSDPPARSWYGLPAPWEPMPVWEAQDAGPTPAANLATPLASLQSVPEPRTAAEAPIVFAPNEAATKEAPAAYQRAGRDRTLADEQRPTAQPPPAQEVAPDLDALARDVYAVLRRRLLAEQRRSGEG